MALILAPPRYYRESYVEKDRYVRNSSKHAIPGVDTMRSFRMTKEEFEKVFLAATRNCASGHYLSTKMVHGIVGKDGKSKMGKGERILGWLGRLLFGRKKKLGKGGNNVEGKGVGEMGMMTVGRSGKAKATVDMIWKRLPNKEPKNGREAGRLADEYRLLASAMQLERGDLDGAGEFLASAIDWRARFGISMSMENADAHTEYAQNLCRRGLVAEAEYHLRCAADIYRQLNKRKARKYGDCLLYLGVLIDRQGRLTEAENFYRAALGVYRSTKLGDDNVRVGIDNLSHNLRAQGRANEVLAIKEAQYNGVILI